MYGKVSTAAAAGAGGAGALAYTGVSVLWYIVAGITLLAAGLALLRIAPKPRKRGVGD